MAPTFFFTFSGPQGSHGLWYGLPLDLDPGPDQIQGVGNEAGGAARGHGTRTLQDHVGQGTGKEQAVQLLKKRTLTK